MSSPAIHSLLRSPMTRHRLLPPSKTRPPACPYVNVNLKTGAVRGEDTNPAEIGTLLLEFRHAQQAHPQAI